MSSGAATVGEMRERLIERAAVDKAFRSRLVADPKAAVEEELGVEIPDGFSIEVHEETPNAVHLSLPPFAGLDDGQLNEVVGGYGIYIPEENVRGLGWG